ncbi:efflux RND transporter permease subunit [Paludisphaera mucosa]|uniref:CusA/CzcA family heavy metal efflux RND transporter n=1 Tax=Paludisphaera mucosa TaxID=3030827 RepID=A0ABT6F415_9BACT|nr:CusA/CzcA family heavy metal efflux RND transporter [Paludisphaera mucosa]MDG3002164.1 CusA/CzcA family heavy metal efflux RND transporter [Paludisphaera mucosa]
MFDQLIIWSLRNRSLVVLALVALAAVGANSLVNLPIDAVPDITNVQVMALTNAPALGPEEVEQFITVPVENEMNGIPYVREVRSFSQLGISGVTVVFEEGTDIYWARQQVGERLGQITADIPPDFGRPEIGPVATGLGEIFQFEVRNAPDAERPRSLMELRTILDWDVARPLKTVPGVVEVNPFGGELKTYEVTVDPARLTARNISMDKVFAAVSRNNANSGGGYIERSGQQRVIRMVGLIGDLEALNEVVIDSSDSGTPICVRDIGEARFAPRIRTGAVTRDGRGEAATATVLMLAGQNSRVVVDRIKAKIAEIQKTLPPGVVVEPFYDRAALIERTIATVVRNLTEGGVLVVGVLLVLLGNLKAGLIVASAIPLSMLFAGNLMLASGIAGSLMSLGALDFGLIVDSGVIVIENCVSRLAHAGPREKAVDVVRRATLEVRKPVVFGVAIITMVHLPILALEGVEGKMFRPMALTVVFALIGSLILSLTATPVLASFFLKPGAKERDTWPIRAAKRLYRPVLDWSVRSPIVVALAAAVALAACIPFAMQLGGEFIPQLDEGDLVVVLIRPPDASLTEGLECTTRFEAALHAQLPDVVRTIVSRTGRPEIGIDPAGVNLTDVFVLLKPAEEWKSVHSKEQLIDRINAIAAEVLPGTFLSFTQPIQLRFNDLLAGVRADVGVSLFGDDLDVLQEKADAIAAVLQKIPGATDVKAQALGGLPFLKITIDRDRIARYGIDASDVLDVGTALGGKIVGQVVEGSRRFDLQVRVAADMRKDAQAIGQLRIRDAQGRLIPLQDVADVENVDGVYEIWRKDRRRRVMIQANVRGRDLASFVREAQAKVESQVGLPRSYTLEWGGTFENLQSATRRLTIVVPVALLLVFLLLYATFQSVGLGLLIFLSVPLGAIGGVMALWLRDLNFSISAGVGFIALSGVAVLDGLVLVSAIRQLIEAGEPPDAAVRTASMSRLRPILMTGMVASLGFVPMAFSHGSGAEVQRPLATVVIGGILTSTLLKLIVIPAIYPWFDPGPPPPPEEETPLDEPAATDVGR